MSEPTVQIGCKYEGDFGQQLCALRTLPRDNVPLVIPRDPSIVERVVQFGIDLLLQSRPH